MGISLYWLMYFLSFPVGVGLNLEPPMLKCSTTEYTLKPLPLKVFNYPFLKS